MADLSLPQRPYLLQDYVIVALEELERRSPPSEFITREWLDKTRAEIDGVLAAMAEVIERAEPNLSPKSVDLPDGDGIALAQVLLKVKPSLLVVIVSGSLDNLDRARRAGLRARLQKPFELAQLKALLECENQSKIT